MFDGLSPKRVRKVQSSLPIPPISGLKKKRRYPENELQRCSILNRIAAGRSGAT